jgi:hypothetical protein
MNKTQFFEKYFPYLYREEHLTFREDIDLLVYEMSEPDKLTQTMDAEIIEQLLIVRRLQRLFFRTKDGRVLGECKKEEKKLDEMIETRQKAIALRQTGCIEQELF